LILILISMLISDVDFEGPLRNPVIPTEAGALATPHHFVIPTGVGAPATAKGGTCCLPSPPWKSGALAPRKL
jgi:hypothetical protein